jgi:hypothetical protein
MMNIIHNCHTYNKVFHRNLNKLAFYQAFTYGAYSFSKFLGGCKIERI